MTFLLNSTSNLSSDGWKLPAEGINGSCEKECRQEGGGVKKLVAGKPDGSSASFQG